MTAAIRRRRRKELFPVTFAPVDWQPQVEVTFTKDVNGPLDEARGVMFHFAAGSTWLIDEQHAVEFITKGYATGQLPRPVSDDERAEIRSAMTTVGLGEAPQARSEGA